MITIDRYRFALVEHHICVAVKAGVLCNLYRVRNKGSVAVGAFADVEHAVAIGINARDKIAVGNHTPRGGGRHLAGDPDVLCASIFAEFHLQPVHPGVDLHWRGRKGVLPVGFKATQQDAIKIKPATIVMTDFELEQS